MKFVRDNDINFYVDSNNGLIIEGFKTNMYSADILKYRVNLVDITGGVKSKMLLVIPYRGDSYLKKIEDVYFSKVVESRVKNKQCLGIIKDKLKISSFKVSDITRDLSPEDYFEIVNCKDSNYTLKNGESCKIVVYR